MSWGHRGTCPHFSKTRVKCPFSCSLVALLESFENAKMNRKYAFPAISEDLTFKISRGSMPVDALTWSALFTPLTKCSISLPETLSRSSSIYVPPPHFYNASYVPGYHEYKRKKKMLSVILETMFNTTDKHLWA